VTDRQREFVHAMLAWINPQLAPKGVEVEVDTLLFATRILDSLKVLELIAFTEDAIGRTIPDTQIRMDNFQTVGRIATVFMTEDYAAA
jgi:acyl carrier protein